MACQQQIWPVNQPANFVCVSAISGFLRTLVCSSSLAALPIMPMYRRPENRGTYVCMSMSTHAYVHIKLLMRLLGQYSIALICNPLFLHSTHLRSPIPNPELTVIFCKRLENSELAREIR